MRLLTTQEFAHILTEAYKIKDDGCLVEALWKLCRFSGEYLYVGRLYDILWQIEEEGYYVYSWQNDIALIKYFIDNFVEEF